MFIVIDYKIDNFLLFVKKRVSFEREWKNIRIAMFDNILNGKFRSVCELLFGNHLWLPCSWI